MTEASSFFFFFFKPQTRSTTFLLILNKYIFTFLCYIHYVNILQKNLALYLLIVVRKEGLLFPSEWLLHKKIKETEYICIGCIWHVGLLKKHRMSWEVQLTGVL